MNMIETIGATVATITLLLMIVEKSMKLSERIATIGIKIDVLDERLDRIELRVK